MKSSARTGTGEDGAPAGRNDMILKGMPPASCRMLAAMLSICLSLEIWSQAEAADASGHARVASKSSGYPSPPQIVRQGRLNVIETQNLRIFGLSKRSDALYWADQCERLQNSLRGKWLGDDHAAAWSPRCDLVLHASADGYAEAVGHEGASTLGVTRIDRDAGRVIVRRIDIRADQPGWFQGVLAHELTHVVLADAFAHSELPLWADEGIALLADPQQKQTLHLGDLQMACKTGGVLPLGEVLAENTALNGKRTLIFYGQSLSLVKFLVDRRTPAEFVRFVHLAGQAGYDAALRDCYGLNGVAELEQQWRQAAFSNEAPSETRLSGRLNPSTRRLTSVARD